MITGHNAPIHVTGAGVYAILCPSLDTRYVGSSIHVSVRFSEHRQSLNKGDHHCIFLQEAWNALGAEQFCFEVLTECAVDSLRQMEQSFIDLYKPHIFNSSWIAGRVEPSPEERAARSRRAIAQHQDGRLGVATWTTGPDYTRIVDLRRMRGNLGCPYTKELREKRRSQMIERRSKERELGLVQMTEEVKRKQRVAHLGPQKTVICGFVQCSKAIEVPINDHRRKFCNRTCYLGDSKGKPHSPEHTTAAAAAHRAATLRRKELSA